MQSLHVVQALAAAPRLVLGVSGSWLRRLATAPAGTKQAGPGDSAQQGAGVFTGTADVRTDKPEEQVATDANRHWLSGKDLGTRAEAALQGAAAASDAEPAASAESLRSTAGGDGGDACHPADPFCSAGEEAPRPDDFHDDGDGSTRRRQAFRPEGGRVVCGWCLWACARSFQAAKAHVPTRPHTVAPDKPASGNIVMNRLTAPIDKLRDAVGRPGVTAAPPTAARSE